MQQENSKHYPSFPRSTAFSVPTPTPPTPAIHTYTHSLAPATADYALSNELDLAPELLKLDPRIKPSSTESSRIQLPFHESQNDTTRTLDTLANMGLANSFITTEQLQFSSAIATPPAFSQTGIDVCGSLGQLNPTSVQLVTSCFTPTQLSSTVQIGTPITSSMVSAVAVAPSFPVTQDPLSVAINPAGTNAIPLQGSSLNQGCAKDAVDEALAEDDGFVRNTNNQAFPFQYNAVETSAVCMSMGSTITPNGLLTPEFPLAPNVAAVCEIQPSHLSPSEQLLRVTTPTAANIMDFPEQVPETTTELVTQLLQSETQTQANASPTTDGKSSSDSRLKKQEKCNIKLQKRRFHCTKLKGCTRSFYCQSDLTRHERIHTGDKPFVCNFDGCTKRFAQKGQLVRHQNGFHKGLKIHRCSYNCDKRFTTSNARKRHERTHTRIAPYTCEDSSCGRSFISRSAYKYHLRMHEHMKSAKTCDYGACGKALSTLAEAQEHKKKHLNTG